MTTIDAGTGSADEATNTVTGSPQIEVRSPADGTTIGTVAACSASDVAATVARPVAGAESDAVMLVLSAGQQAARRAAATLSQMRDVGAYCHHAQRPRRRHTRADQRTGAGHP